MTIKNKSTLHNEKRLSEKSKKLYCYRQKLHKKRLRRKLLKMSFRLTFLVLSVYLIVFITKSLLYKPEKNILVTNETNEEYKDSNSSLESSEDLSDFTVCIDPGHGGYDNGTKSSSNIYEKDITLKIALKLGNILKEKNINIVYTRKNDDVPWPSNNVLDLRARAKISNDSKADAFVSIHCNSNPSSSFKGIESWCRFPNTDGETLAKNIQNKLVSSGYSIDRGLKYEANGSLAVLKFNNSPSALIEIGFLNNSSDASFITSTKGQDVCAKAISDGIIKYLSSKN